MAAFQRIALDYHNLPTFLESTCFPKLDGTVQAARELQAVQSVMFLKVKLDTAGWVHSRAEEENYRDSIRIMQTFKERHGKDIEFMALLLQKSGEGSSMVSMSNASSPPSTGPKMSCAGPVGTWSGAAWNTSSGLCSKGPLPKTSATCSGARPVWEVGGHKGGGPFVATRRQGPACFCQSSTKATERLVTCPHRGASSLHPCKTSGNI